MGAIMNTAIIPLFGTWLDTSQPRDGASNSVHEYSTVAVVDTEYQGGPIAE
jgi:hypothetical protein